MESELPSGNEEGKMSSLLEKIGGPTSAKGSHEASLLGAPLSTLLRAITSMVL